jgi:hypothetical protein
MPPTSLPRYELLFMPDPRTHMPLLKCTESVRVQILIGTHAGLQARRRGHPSRYG